VIDRNTYGGRAEQPLGLADAAVQRAVGVGEAAHVGYRHSAASWGPGWTVRGRYPPAGLILMGAGFLIASTLGSNTAYFGPVLVSMVLMAVGLGLVTAPSTGAILAVLPLGKAGVGSAVNDVTRELGGTFGVAVVGAVFSTVYGPRLAQLLHGAGLPAPALAAAQQSPAAALQLARLSWIS
jgi:hypothetical protein